MRTNTLSPGRKRSLLLLLSAIAAGAGFLGSCKSGPSEAVWMTSHGDTVRRTGNSHKWEAYATADGEVVCVIYSDLSRPVNFTTSCGWDHDDRWIKVNDGRLDLRKGQCVLITNGRSGELLQTTVPWMKEKEFQSDPNKNSMEDSDEILARVQKLFEPLISKP